MNSFPDRRAFAPQFPALAIKDGGRPRVYFDNPAGTQVPQQVIERTRRGAERQERQSRRLFHDHGRRPDELVE